MSPPTCGRPLVVAALLAVVTLSAETASATTVLLVPPDAPSAAMTEAIARVRGELTSDGFTVEVEPRLAESGDGRSATAPTADAIVTIVGDPLPAAVEIRMQDPVSHEAVVRRMSFQSNANVTAKTLAIHTLELIRATFLELDLLPAPRPPDSPRARAQPATASTPTGAASGTALVAPERVGLDVGAAAVFALDTSPPAVLPLLRVSWVARPWLLPHLTVAGLGTRRTVRGESASASVAQQLALVGASYRVRPGARVRPFVSLAAGVLHTSARGEAPDPEIARSDQQWSLLLDSAAGMAVSLSRRLQLALAVHAQLAQPYPAVRFAEGTVKASTRPGLIVTVTLGAWR